MTLTIRDLRARSARVPLTRPVATKVGAFSDWPLVLVDLLTEEGVTGRGYLAPYVDRAAATVMTALKHLEAVVTGQPVAPRDLHAAALGAFNLMGYSGASRMATAALDMAAWDALAQAQGVPLVTLLGGSASPVRAYNSNGLGLMPPERVADEALELITEGNFKGLKVRVGRDSFKEDLKAIENVRAAVGNEIMLVVDFNQGLSLAEAMRRCHALDALGLGWIEEPIRYDDLVGNAKLAHDLHTPLMLGENFYGPRDMLRALAAGATDLVMPDLMRIGGVTGWLQAAGLASAWGVDMSSHLYPEISAHLMRVTPTAGWLEWQDWAHPVLARPFEVKNSHVQIPDIPGNGLSWNEDAVKHYQTAL